MSGVDLLISVIVELLKECDDVELLELIKSMLILAES